MWAFKTLWDKGLIYEGFRVLAYCWRCETPLSNTETRMDDVYRDRQDPALTVGFELRRPARRLLALDHHALDAAVEPGARGRARHRLRRRRDSTAPGTCSPRRGSANYAAELGEATTVGHAEGRRPRRPSLHAAVRLLRRHGRTRSRCSPPTSCRPRTAPASCTSRPASARTTRSSANAAGIPTIVPDGRARPLHRARCADWAGTHVFDANPRSSAS